MDKTCDACNGDCYEFDSCSTCNRDGWVEDEEDGGTMTCPDCLGDAAELCTVCYGEGLVEA